MTFSYRPTNRCTGEECRLHPETERLIRRDIRARWVPLFLLFWMFIGTVVGLGLIGCLGFLERFLRTQGVLFH